MYFRGHSKFKGGRFDDLVASGGLVSCREALREIENGGPQLLVDWAANHTDLFAMPTAAEALFIKEIYAVPHFQQNIEQQKLLKGGTNADPFVIAKAAIEQRAVVTMELRKPNSAKIPSICDHFRVKCFSLEEFMDEEGWAF